MLTVDFDRLGLRPGDRVLDMGCGAGRHAFEMFRRGGDVIAFDQNGDELAGVLEIFGAMREAGEVPAGADADIKQGDALAMPFADEGHTIEPLVSVPIANAARLADTAAPDPELEPQGLRSSAHGLRHWPPRPDQPLEESRERKFAHSERFALPSSTAPAARSFAATVASRGDTTPSSASDPAVVVVRSWVETLSLSSTGTPWSGPRTRPARRSSSRARALATASGSVSITE